MTESGDLTREVYGVLGIPIDAISMAGAIRRIENAVASGAPFFISTANLNFLVTSRSDPTFRDSLLMSDLCTADGVPIVWMARLLGIPIPERIAGATIFEALKFWRSGARRLKVFFFGGPDGVAAAACKKLNAEHCALHCVGSFYPGFRAIDEMSGDEVIDAINASNADFLAVALGAQKGQVWLQRNHQRLLIPVRAHLGATINFQAGALRRAPLGVQKYGLEWLWRIKEEPQLWKRYLNDGLALGLLLITRVIPLIVITGWDWLITRHRPQDLQITRRDDHESVIFSLNGVAAAENVGIALPYFVQAVGAAKSVVINFADTRQIDARFLGLILMLNKQLRKQGRRLDFTGVSSRIATIFRLNGFEFLLRRAEQ